jgi:non-specific serine/threonine protein kinase
MVEAETTCVFTIRLLGAIDIRVHGQPIPPLRSRAGLWLLALLILRHPRPVERDWLAGTLWPDTDPTKGLQNLRQRLSELRRALGAEGRRLLTPSARTLSLDLEGAEVDLLEFDAALVRGDALSLKQAVERYRGELLEGCSAEWIHTERRRREEDLLTMLERLAGQASADREPGVAACYLRRVIEIDLLRESAHRALMQALADDGDYAAATQVYSGLRQHLYRELQADPDPETVALYHRLRCDARERVTVARTNRVTIVESVPASSPDNCTNNLPAPTTSFVGREAEMAEVTRLLERTRLLTLTGTGGVGKTRLALEVGAGLLADFPDGVWFVEMAALTDPHHVTQAMASSLGITEQPDRPLLQTVSDSLRPRSLLLILDNCEHLVAACATIVETLLRACPNVKVLATSRETLRVSGEQTWRVPSLLPPDPERLPVDEQDLAGIVGEYDAVRLFVERATSQRADFRLTNPNVHIVARICSRLDGIPLAIELAAARVRALPLEQLAARLDDRFRVLTGGSRTSLPRQQTLRALIDWSYNLLSARERQTLHRLSVFAGGWTLEAAEAICGEEDTLDLLTTLVDRSLVQYEEPQGQERYRLLETIQQYARDRLREGDEEEVVRTRHCDYFLTLARGAQLKGADALYWLDRLETEHDNLRAALRWALRSPQAVEESLSALTKLGSFWIIRGYVSEGHAWNQAFLAVEGVKRTWAWAQILAKDAVLRLDMGDAAGARRQMEECVAISREQGDLYFALFNYGDLLNNIGDFAAARIALEEGLALALANGKNGEGMRCNLGITHFYLGNYAEARRLLTADLTYYQDHGHEEFASEVNCFLGRVALALSEFEAARAHFTASLILGRDLNYKNGILRALFGVAGLAAAAGQMLHAARLYGAHQRLHDLQGTRLCIADQPEYNHSVTTLRPALGEAAFTAAFNAVQNMSWEQAIEYALSCMAVAHPSESIDDETCPREQACIGGYREHKKVGGKAVP